MRITERTIEEAIILSVLTLYMPDGSEFQITIEQCAERGEASKCDGCGDDLDDDDDTTCIECLDAINEQEAAK